MGKRKKENGLNSTVVGLGQTIHVQRNGEAASQMIQAYSGEHYDSAGNQIDYQGRSLKKISEYKVDPNNPEKSIKAQAGFTAEQIHEARQNAEKIRNGDPTRVRTTDSLGMTNDPVNDFLEIDANGNIIAGRNAQMKFLGVYKGRYKVVDELAKPEWDKYKDSKILIPDEQYEGAVKYAAEKAESLRKQAEHLMADGNKQKAEELLELAKKYDRIKNQLEKSSLSTQEAIDARVNPKKFVANEVARDCMNAGLQSMKCAALMSGIVAAAQNTVSFIKGEKDAADAALDTVDAAISAGATGFVTGSAGTAIKAAMHTSKNAVIRHLGTTTAPTMIVTGIIDVSKSLISFAKGEIDAVELFEQLGEKGACSIASGIGASIGGTVGSLVGPAGTIVGGMVGGLAAYSLCAAVYNSGLDVLKDAKIAHERRLFIEEMCNESIRRMEDYRAFLRDYGQAQVNKEKEIFDNFFVSLDRSIASKDITAFYRSFDEVNNMFGIEPKFRNFDEFDDFMNDENSILSF